ncbi:MAG: hypothetical protein R3F33_09680 [Planctomycetota bacterium]
MASPADPDPPQDPTIPPKSYGNMGPEHWTRTRETRNAEAIDYYRERSRAPGVAEGGGPRNFYCMECDGVIPHDPPATTCPHCGAAVSGQTRRYFNWVEIDSPPDSDWKALRPYFLAAALLLGLLVWWIVR